LSERVSSGSKVYEAAQRSVRELAVLSWDEEPQGPAFFSDWAEMVSWAVEEGYLPSREREAVRRFKSRAGRKSSATSRNGRGQVSISMLEDACRRGRAHEAWDVYRLLAPLSDRGAPPALFAPEMSESGDSPAALFRACTEGILGVRPDWKGLRVNPCLPPTWKSARMKREFRGAEYSFRFRRDASRPAGFLGIALNGRKVRGNLLPPLFGRKNEVLVTVGRAR
jgi:hypothetical protein